MGSMPTELSAVEKAQSEELGAYERLLTDAIQGDDMLFVREDAVEAAWSIVDPILDNVVPVHLYEPGSWGLVETDQFAAGIGGWHNPQPQP
jgi:glucose-6-phosphate 1-dehydrogenase